MGKLSPEGGWGGWGGWGGGGGWGGWGGWGPDGGAPPAPEALIYSRDGIVGPWAPPPKPNHLALDTVANLARWEPWVRASIYDFEIVSRLAFSRKTAAAKRMRVWHLELDQTTTPPGAQYKRLVDMRRPTMEMFKDHLVFLDRYADLRPDRAPEIMSQLGGGMAFLSSIAFVHPDRTPWTVELLTAAVRLANYVEMRLKHALACRRPHEFSPQVQPMILTPSHSAYPSGHATEAFIAALVLWRLLRTSPSAPYANLSWGTQLLRLAARIAINRTVAGVHFPVDSAAGALLGLTLGNYLVALCERVDADGAGNAEYTAWRFNGNDFPKPSDGNPAPNDGDFYWYELCNVNTLAQRGNAYVIDKGVQKIVAANQSAVLHKLWQNAAAEWT